LVFQYAQFATEPRDAADEPLIAGVLFLDDCLPRNLRELDYLVIHISPQFAAP
jgi:hypothetical protein